MLKLSLKEGEYVNFGDIFRVVYACTGYSVYPGCTFTLTVIIYNLRACGKGNVYSGIPGL